MSAGSKSGPDPLAAVRPEVRALTAYHLEPREGRFKLDQNEVPWDLPRRLKQRMARRLAATRWAEYPDFHGDELRRAVGRRHGWPWQGVLVGNGSGELLGTVLEALVAAGGEVVGHAPSFSLYDMLVVRRGGRGRWLGPSPDLSIPFEALLAAAEREPGRPMLLCSPNNPVGDAVTPEQAAALLERLTAPLLLDNAYGEFCEHDYRPLLHRFRHLILLRTLSKAWSLAGMRLGYLLADPRLVLELIKVKFPYNMNHASLLAGLTALEEPAFGERVVRVLLARRSQWAEMLAGFGLEVFPSQTNFLLVRCPGGQAEAAAVRQGLARRGVLVRDVSSAPGLAGCFRLGLGTGGALRATRQALAEIFAEEVVR